METTLLSPESLVRLDPMTAGFTKTMLSVYGHPHRGIYKPRINPILHPLNAISGSHRKEVAAYELDKLLGIFMVPYTRKIVTSEYGVGSEQFFVRNSIRARDMGNYNTFRPRKFSSPHGRNQKDRNMLFFDWLISNYDRNLDNYLLTPDGTVVMIDHGFSFLRRIALRPSTREVLSMIPSKRVFNRLSALNQNSGSLDKRVRPWLKSRQYRILKKQMRYFEVKVRSLLQADPNLDLFADADGEERRRGWQQIAVGKLNEMVTPPE